MSGERIGQSRVENDGFDGIGTRHVQMPLNDVLDESTLVTPQ